MSVLVLLQHWTQLLSNSHCLLKYKCHNLENHKCIFAKICLVKHNLQQFILLKLLIAQITKIKTGNCVFKHHILLYTWQLQMNSRKSVHPYLLQLTFSVTVAHSLISPGVIHLFRTASILVCFQNIFNEAEDVHWAIPQHQLSNHLCVGSCLAA